MGSQGETSCILLFFSLLILDVNLLYFPSAPPTSKFLHQKSPLSPSQQLKIKIAPYYSHVLVLALDLMLIVENAFGLTPSRVEERGLVFLASALTGTSAAATIIPIEMKAWTSSS